MGLTFITCSSFFQYHSNMLHLHSGLAGGINNLSMNIFYLSLQNADLWGSSAHLPAPTSSAECALYFERKYNPKALTTNSPDLQETVVGIKNTRFSMCVGPGRQNISFRLQSLHQCMCCGLLSSQEWQHYFDVQHMPLNTSHSMRSLLNHKL